MSSKLKVALSNILWVVVATLYQLMYNHGIKKLPYYW